MPAGLCSWRGFARFAQGRPVPGLCLLRASGICGVGIHSCKSFSCCSDTDLCIACSIFTATTPIVSHSKWLLRQWLCRPSAVLAARVRALLGPRHLCCWPAELHSGQWPLLGLRAGPTQCGDRRMSPVRHLRRAGGVPAKFLRTIFCFFTLQQ